MCSADFFWHTSLNAHPWSPTVAAGLVCQPRSSYPLFLHLGLSSMAIFKVIPWPYSVTFWVFLRLLPQLLPLDPPFLLHFLPTKHTIKLFSLSFSPSLLTPNLWWVQNPVFILCCVLYNLDQYPKRHSTNVFQMNQSSPTCTDSPHPFLCLFFFRFCLSISSPWQICQPKKDALSVNCFSLDYNEMLFILNIFN